MFSISYANSTYALQTLTTFNMCLILEYRYRGIFANFHGCFIDPVSIIVDSMLAKQWYADTYISTHYQHKVIVALLFVIFPNGLKCCIGGVFI